MKRNLVVFLLGSLVCLVGGSSHLSAQEWARKMFSKRSHDFGAVARGSKSEFRFEFTNLYKETIHVASVRSSCGCTTPRIEKQSLGSLQKSAIVARFNTHSFLGSRSATITVTIDKPFFAEVQLQVSGYIRSDVVFRPGAVQFGEVAQGASAKRVVQIEYAGNTGWRIVDVRSANDHLEVELDERERRNGRVSYFMTVRLKPTADVGYLRDQLALITNDEQRSTIAIPVEGRIASPLSVRPSSLLFGDVNPGGTVTKKLVVHGKKPFKVLSIKCGKECFQWKAPSESRKIHLVPVTFRAPATKGRISDTVTITTDLGVTARCTLSAEVR